MKLQDPRGQLPMLRTYRYRLYPRKAEARALETMLAQGCEVYNAALAECKRRHQG